MIKVVDVTDETVVERELILARVNAPASSRAEILRIVDIFRAAVVDVTATQYIIELTGAQEKLEAFIELLRPFGIKSLYRTGKVVMQRGSKSRNKRK